MSTQEQNWNDRLEIYTDRSKNAEETGTSIWIPKLKLKKQQRISQYLPIYTAEILEIRLALLTVKEHNLENVIILTDSLATLQTLKAQDINTKTNCHALHIKNYYTS
jgi:ribonuclease HI